MEKKYFKAGEFAKLCGVKKDTLLHYDKIGLLKPEYTAKNGYRYYSMEQFYTFDTISVFKELGTPLSKIKEYLMQKGTENFIEILKEKSREFSMEQKRIEKMRRMLANTIFLSEKALHVKCGIIEIRHLPEEYYIITKALDYQDNSISDYFENIKNHIDYCRTSGYGDEFPMGEIILYENLVNDKFFESYYCTRCDEKADDPFFHVKESGEYAIAYYRCPYEDLYDKYALFKESVLKLGYSIAGNIYEEDQLNYMSVNNPNEFLFKISARIKT